jgi:hypothetical protein
LNPPGELINLVARYATAGDVPSGEAFHQAYRRFMKTNRESLLDVAATAAAAHVIAGDSREAIDPLLMSAVHDTNPSINQERFLGLDDEAMQGAINTAKGKYFEYLVVERLNDGEQVGSVVLQDGQRALLAESMTQPGWDLQIVDAQGASVEYLQLKATESIGYVHAALERYPDFRILATEEVADGALVLNSGISEADLRAQVSEAVDVADTSVTSLFLDYFNPLLPLAVMAGWEGYCLVMGERSVDEFKLALARRGQRAVATQLVGAAVYALGGGYAAIPVAIAGGLLFDRFLNQTQLIDAYQQSQKKLLALRLMQQERMISKEQPWVS